VNNEEWHLLRCHPVEESSPTLERLRRHIVGNASQGIFTCAQSSPYVRIPESWNAFEAGLSPNFRKQLRKAKRHSNADFAIVDSVSGVDRTLPEVFAVAEKAWAGAKGTAISSTPEHRAFYTELSYRAAQDGGLFLSVLRVGGKCIAFSYDIRYRDRIYSTKTAYDPEYASLSPGNLLTAFLLEHICDHLSKDIREYEMLGEAEPYKLRWTPLRRNHVKTHIYHPSKAYARILSYAHSALMLHPQARKAVAKPFVA
jgi:CelD/BcsL family acetyltransferase involved in cellulose biosynthesis